MTVTNEYVVNAELVDCAALQIVDSAAEIARLQQVVENAAAFGAEAFARIQALEERLAEAGKLAEYARSGWLDAQEQVERYRVSYTNMCEYRDAAQRQHREDIQRISDTLTQEATDRGWCSEYDELVNSLNRYLHVELETREKDYYVSYTVTVRVTACGEDAAREMAHEDMRRAENSAYNGLDWSCDDVEECG